MRRGTRVGQAYVSVTADGSGINDEIADAFDDVDYKDIGDRHGKEYGKAFQQRLKGFQDDIAKEFRGRLNKQTSRISNDLVKAFEFDSAARQSVSKSVSDLFDQGRLDTLIDFVGRRAGANFGAGFDDEIRRTVLDSLESTLAEAARRGNGNGTGLFTIDQNGIRQIGPAIEKAISDVARLQQRIDTDVQKSFLETERLSEKNADIARKFAEARVRIVEKANDAIAQSERDLRQEQQKIFDQAARDNDALWRVRRASADAYVKYVAQLERGQIDVFGNTIRKNAKAVKQLENRFDGVNASLSEFENLIGRVTGRGSRNNFLNFIGSTTRNLTRLGTLLPRIGAQLAGVFTEGFSGAGGGPSGILAGLTASGSFALKGLASNAVIAAGALVVFAAAIGPIVAAMSLLLGTVTALASSLTFALAGAIAAITAAFVPFIAGIGVATLAIQGLDKAQKKALANDFKPLVEQAKDLRSALADAFVGGFDSEGVSGNLTEGLKTVQPLLERIAVAVGDVFERFASIGTSPAFRQFVGAMQSVLPQAVRNIGNGLAGFTEGFLGVLRALAPTIESVAQSISDAGDRFSEWANSASGQRSLTEFFDNAAESLSVVKDFLGEVGGLIGDLFSAGRGTGDNLFKSLTDAVAEFREFIDDGQIQKWFKDSEEFAKSLGDAIVGIGRVVDALDNDFTRLAANAWVQGLELSFGVLEGSINVLKQAILGVGIVMLGQAELILGAFDAVAEGIGSVVSGFLNNLATLTDVLSELPRIGGAFKGIGDRLRGAADSVGDFGDKLDGARERVRGLKDDLKDVAKGVSPQDLNKLDTLRSTITRIPDEVITEIVAEGTDLSRKKIRDLIKEYNLSPGEINTLVKLLGDEPAKNSIDNLIDKADQFNRSRPSPLISVRDQATGVLNNILTKRNALQDKSFTVTAVYRTQRAPGASPGFGPDDPSQRSVAPRSVSTLPDDAAGRTVSTLQRAATDAVNVLPEIAARATAEAESKGKKAAKGVEAAFKSINKRLAASIQRSVKGTGAEEARSAVQAAIERLRGYIGENGKNKKAVQSLAKDLREQTKVSQGVVKRLVAGRRVEDATLADFAAARARLATKIEKANDQLAEALAIRDDFAASVADSVRSFGSILGAEASVIDGVTQDLSATDITSNLQSRLDKIRKFQDNLRILLAQGLSDDAYKQLVEAGVENGSAYVEALVNGQAGTIDQVNSLVGQIGSVADQLGLETSNRLYQAGVDAAQGLVDGLESKSEQLDNAAAKLGASIARAITRALGLGDGPGGDGKGGGKGDGKGNQSGRRASEYIFPTPAAATYSTTQRNTETVSGNGMRDVSLTVITPTQDPRAVAVEALNEMTGRLM